MSYLQSRTENQYFIATHSATFIDTPDAAIFHVSMKNSLTHIREAIFRRDRFAICTDLGHRASDIVQANAIIWVEGPSDRIYLKHWLEIASSDFVEGIHYSIMFYGGRLLSHLSADDDEVTEFIQLRSLNRHLAIVMDSDKSSVQSRVNGTKQRIRDELGKYGGIAWVTKGREIENYISYDRLQRAVRKVYGAIYGCSISDSQFGHALHFKRANHRKRRGGRRISDCVEREVDKVKVSRVVVEDGVRDLNVLDLSDRVADVVNMIRKANE